MKEFNWFNAALKSGVVIVMCFMLLDLSGQTDTQKPLSQFLFPTFSKGIVKMKDGRTLTAILNYNMVDEVMVFEQKGVYMVVEKPQEFDTVSIQNRKFVYIGKAFYEVVCKGKVTLFIENECHLTTAGSATAYGMTSKTLGPTKVWTMQSGNQVRNIDLPDDVVVASSNVYWAQVNGKMNKFTNEKQFLKLFPGSEDKIKEFIKTSKIDIKSREGLMNLGNFCNEL
jgi:hypothetical protein